MVNEQEVDNMTPKQLIFYFCWQALHQETIVALSRDISFQMLFHKIHMEVLGE